MGAHLPRLVSPVTGRPSAAASSRGPASSSVDRGEPRPLAALVALRQPRAGAHVRAGDGRSPSCSPRCSPTRRCADGPACRTASTSSRLEGDGAGDARRRLVRLAVLADRRLLALRRHGRDRRLLGAARRRRAQVAPTCATARSSRERRSTAWLVWALVGTGAAILALRRRPAARRCWSISACTGGVMMCVYSHPARRAQLDDAAARRSRRSRLAGRPSLVRRRRLLWLAWPCS